MAKKNAQDKEQDATKVEADQEAAKVEAEKAEAEKAAKEAAEKEAAEKEAAEKEAAEKEAAAKEAAEKEAAEKEAAEKEAAEKEAAEKEAAEKEAAVPKKGAPKPSAKAQQRDFFEQYLDLVKKRRPEQAIKALNNCIKTTLKTNDAKSYSELLTKFKKERILLDPKVALQSAATVSREDRAVLETMFVIIRALVYNPHTPLNLDIARGVIKNDTFMNWVVKEMAKEKAR